MRKNSPRKWLHAILDLLPVLILPIFALAVRSDNNFQPIEVQAQENEVVDFNQLVKNTQNFYFYSEIVDNTTQWNNVYLTSGNPIFKIEGLVSGHKYYVKDALTSYAVFTDEENTTIGTGNPRIRYNGSYSTLYTSNSTFIFDNTSYYIDISFTSAYRNQYFVMSSKLQLFDLTQMFGSGNEPTYEEFNSYFDENYYSYTISKKTLIDVGTTTYNDTDVGSQMVYTLYNATDKYFNFNNVFNFGQLYEWFVLNIFNGNATLIFPVVWNIVLYEFIMDLVFLIYALFMFFIDFCTNLIDRFHVKCSGGK